MQQRQRHQTQEKPGKRDEMRRSMSRTETSGDKRSMQLRERRSIQEMLYLYRLDGISTLNTHKNLASYQDTFSRFHTNFKCASCVRIEPFSNLFPTKTKNFN